MNVYRIYPTLWEGTGCYDSMTVYAIDRSTSAISSTCSTRPRADPATTWESRTFQRLLSQDGQSVVWATLPAWISWVQSLGYTLSNGSSLMTLKPYGDLYIVGP